jgi:hypothetical protein
MSGLVALIAERYQAVATIGRKRVPRKRPLLNVEGSGKTESLDGQIVAHMDVKRNKVIISAVIGCAYPLYIARICS